MTSRVGLTLSANAGAAGEGGDSGSENALERDAMINEVVLRRIPAERRKYLFTAFFWRKIQSATTSQRCS